VAFSKLSSLLNGRIQTGASTLPQPEHRSQDVGHYDPNQPRVPKGVREGGQWTHGWLGEGWVALALSKARKRIELWRQKHARRDLWGRISDPKQSAVARTTLNGRPVYGPNSGHHEYKAADRIDRREKERILVEKYSEDLRRRPINEFPGQAMKHAEVTVLLRAARRNSGTLAGQTLDVEVDRKLCPSCEIVLPLLGRELGNPTVTFTDSEGRRFLMSRGSTILKRLDNQ